MKAHTPNEKDMHPSTDYDQTEMVSHKRHHCLNLDPEDTTYLLQDLEVPVIRTIDNRVYSESHHRKSLRPQVRQQPSQQAIIMQCNHHPQDNPASSCDWTGRRFGLSDTKNSVSSNLQLRLAGRSSCGDTWTGPATWAEASLWFAGWARGVV